MSKRLCCSVILVLAAAAGCAPAGSIDPGTGEVHPDAFISSGLLWKNHNIPVCWENPGDDQTQRNWVADQVTKTWSAASSLRFTGWGKCEAGSKGIRIQINNTLDTGYSYVGTYMDGRPSGMHLPFDFHTWGQGCIGREEYCIRAVAAHEFGHAIGFSHEQNRPDTPGNCTEEKQGGGGDMVIGGWDLHSIMNYCNPQWDGDGRLSETDKTAVRLAYDVGLSGLIFNDWDYKCLEPQYGSTERGTPLVLYPCNGNITQRWHWQGRPDGSWQMINNSNNRCVDISGWSGDSGAGAILWDCHGGDNQAFDVVNDDKGTHFRAKHSGKCLDLGGWSQADGAGVIQWDCHGGLNQSWMWR
jgi:hypothetical protein